MSIPTSVTDHDILPAFQVFDADKIGVLEAEVILKSLTNVGEPLTDVEAKAFKDSMKINEQGQFDYSGRLPSDADGSHRSVRLEFFLKFTQPAKTKKKGKKKGKKKKTGK